MTKLQQLQQEMFNLKTEARTVMNREGVTEAEMNEVANRITELQAKINLEIQIGEGATAAPQARGGQQLPRSDLNGGDVDPNSRYEEALFNALRGTATADDITLLQEARNALSSETLAAGGCLIPVDQQTEINELKRTFTALRDLVTVEPVSTLSGSRVLEKDAEHIGFSVIGENKPIGNTASPEFDTVTYSVKKYGGILPIPSELLADENARLRSYLNRWLAKKSIATENTLISTLLNTFTKKEITGIDDVKDVLDIELDPSISVMSSVILNQDSFNYFNKLKDSQGNYLLEKDPKNPTKKLLSGRPVVVLSNKVLKTNLTKAPVIIGALKEGVVLFDRQAITLLATNTGGEAFINDRTDVRAIMRLDVQKFDASSVIYGELDLAAVSTNSNDEE